MSKKRKIAETNSNNDFLVYDYISDNNKMVTENAILNILHYIPLQQKNSIVNDELLIPRGVFVHQLFSIVENKTLVHAEVQQLQKNGDLKLLYCLNQDGPSNYFIMIMNDYLWSIQFMIDNLCSKYSSDIDSKKNELYMMRAKSLEKFRTFSLSSKNISIFREDILKELSSDEILDILETGFLSYRRDTTSTEDMYWYSHPSFGYLNEWIRLTREYVKNTIQRKKYKEISCKSRQIISLSIYTYLLSLYFNQVSELVKTSNKVSSKMGMQYHIYDMKGKEMIATVPLPTRGILIRLV